MIPSAVEGCYRVVTCLSFPSQISFKLNPTTLPSLSWCYIISIFFRLHVVISPLFPPDALLADLESTGSPLARCPVLLTSDPPQKTDPVAQDPAESRPPPPAYTPQQVLFTSTFSISVVYCLYSCLCNISCTTFTICLSTCFVSQTVSAAIKSSQNSNPDKLYR